MGLFDKMFGKGATEEDAQTKRFDELKNKYATTLNVLDQQRIQLYNLHLQDNKLFLRGVAPSQDAINKVWDQITFIESRLHELEQSAASEQTLRKAKAALTELHDSCTLIKALLCNVSDNGNGQSIKVGAN